MADGTYFNFDTTLPSDGASARYGAQEMRSIKTKILAWGTVLCDTVTGLLKTGSVTSAMLAAPTATPAASGGTPSGTMYSRFNVNAQGQVIKADAATLDQLASLASSKLAVTNVAPSATGSQLLRTNSGATACEFFTGLTASKHVSSDVPSFMELDIARTTGSAASIKSAAMVYYTTTAQTYYVDVGASGIGGGGNQWANWGNDLWKNTGANPTASIQINSIAYQANPSAGHHFVCVGNAGKVYTDDSPANTYAARTHANFGAGSNLNCVTYGAEWVVCGTDNSGTAAVWSLGTTVGTSGALPTSSAQTLSPAITVGTQVFYGVANKPSGAYVVVGTNGNIYSGTVGGTWTQRTNPAASPTATLNGVVYGGGLFVAVGASGTIIRSSDGTTWSASTSGVGTELKSVAYGGGVYVAVGASGVILISTDAISWTARTTKVKTGTDSDATTVGTVATTWNCVAYCEGTFYLVGDSGKRAYGGLIPLTEAGATGSSAAPCRFPHDLAAVPDLLQARAVCVRDDTTTGYVAGDETNLVSLTVGSAGTALGGSLTPKATATMLHFYWDDITSSAVNNYQIRHKTTGALVNIKHTYWRVKLVAAKLS